MTPRSSSRSLDSPLLELKSIRVAYGAIDGVRGLSFQVGAGEIVTLIGSNGAGKTSTLRAISGLAPVRSGSILLRGKPIQNMAPHHVVEKRISQAPEGRGIFLNLTVEENLDLGAWLISKKSEVADGMDTVYGLFPRLKERRGQNAGTLSGGELQMLSIGRALMARPEVLLLDEPSLGLAPQMIEKIFEIIVRINKEGKTVVLVEQNAAQALQIAHYGLVLESGQLALEGPASKLLKMDEVRQAYLGELH